ncbi:hypothetical protein GS399_15560 [Pedobacter sp. HMF7647]|uniref:Lipoprotein n=1 Tax=Hufsiella arboris TaxID=2695275 RepID=A0A7K1YDF1_9SPHI|nr:hypothetical protein [Hufsiella arboris]MXV52391.1 hypothetical protein [Hufsiella arboris]
MKNLLKKPLLKGAVILGLVVGCAPLIKASSSFNYSGKSTELQDTTKKKHKAKSDSTKWDKKSKSKSDTTKKDSM